MTSFFDKLKKGMNLPNNPSLNSQQPEDIEVLSDNPNSPKEIETEELEEKIEGEPTKEEIKTAGVKNFILSSIQETEKSEKKAKKSTPSKKNTSPKDDKKSRKQVSEEKFFIPEPEEIEEPSIEDEEEKWLEPDGQLVIDVYETKNEIIIQSAIAGVVPENLDISIEKDIVSIRGKREKTIKKENGKYLIEECHWGSFSREIILPTEIDADKAEATMKNGVLTIRASKIERERKKVEIK